MDVTLPIGVATASGTPSAGGVPDVLAQLAGTDPTLARDAFAALLASLGLAGLEPPSAPVDAVDADVDAGDAQEPAPEAQAAQVAALLPQASPPAIIAALAGAAGVATSLAASATTASEVPATDGASVPTPVVQADVQPTVVASSRTTAASPNATVPVAAAQAVEGAPISPHAPRRAATVEAPGGTSATEEPATVGDAANPLVTSVATPDAQPSGRDPVQPQADPTGPAPTRTHEATPRPRDPAPMVAAEQPMDAPRLETAAIAGADPAEVLRRRDAVSPPAAEPAVDARHVAPSEAVTATPRPVAAAQTPPSDATTAYRHAEAATLPELPRPLGRLPDGGEMRLEVTPEGLGPIEIRVAVRADAVQASLWTQQDHARAALEAHRPMLVDALGRSSLRLEEFTVGVGQHHHGAQDDDRTPRRWANQLAAEPVAAPVFTHAPVRTRGLSLRV